MPCARNISARIFVHGGDVRTAFPEPHRDFAAHRVQDLPDLILQTLILHAALPPPVEDIQQIPPNLYPSPAV